MLRTTRRQFCEQALLGMGAMRAVGASAALSSLGCRTSSSSSAPAPASADAGPASSFVPKTFTAASFATLSAVCERLLPRDQDPGAIDLGVPGYIDAAVVTPELAPVREMLVKVMPLLDKDASKRFGGKAFHEAASDEQDTVLDAWRHGKEGSQHFFDVILSLTMEGAFGDPKYGGNIGGRGFDMIGFRPDPPLKKMAMPNMPATQDGSTAMPSMPGMQDGSTP